MQESLHKMKNKPLCHSGVSVCMYVCMCVRVCVCRFANKHTTLKLTNAIGVFCAHAAASKSPKLTNAIGVFGAHAAASKTLKLTNAIGLFGGHAAASKQTLRAQLAPFKVSHIHIFAQTNIHTRTCFWGGGGEVDVQATYNLNRGIHTRTHADMYTRMTSSCGREKLLRCKPPTTSTKAHALAR